jgi:type II secretory pathway pseudopilin PulG
MSITPHSEPASPSGPFEDRRAKGSASQPRIPTNIYPGLEDLLDAELDSEMDPGDDLDQDLDRDLDLDLDQELDHLNHEGQETQEIDGLLSDYARDLEATLKPSRAALEARIRSGLMKRRELVTSARLARLNTRFVLYATQLAACLIIALVYVASVASLVTLRRRERVRATTNELRALGIGTKAYIAEQQRLPDEGNQGLIHSLLTPKPGREGRSYLPISSEDRAQRLVDGRLIDLWGRPYVFRIKTQTNDRRLLIYSCGPNGRDDEGLDDDIPLDLPLD